MDGQLSLQPVLSRKLAGFKYAAVLATERRTSEDSCILAILAIGVTTVEHMAHLLTPYTQRPLSKPCKVVYLSARCGGVFSD